VPKVPKIIIPNLPIPKSTITKI